MAHSKPVPALNEPDTADFWRAAQEHDLTYQTCDSCGRVVFYARAHCTGCGGGELTPRRSLGSGTVYSYTIIRQTPDPAFREDVPYCVALVDLDEGFRVLSQIHSEIEDVVVGQRVEVHWVTRSGVELPAFVAASS